MEAENLYPQRRAKRHEATPAERLERSKSRANAMQFVWIAGLAAAAGTLAFHTVKGALSQPLAIISAQLAPRK